MSMMSQAEGASVVTEGVRSSDPAQLAMSSTSPGGGEPSTSAARMEWQAQSPEPANIRLANERALAARVARRSRLADQIRAEHPNYTNAEIEERLEQFGA